MGDKYVAAGEPDEVDLGSLISVYPNPTSGKINFVLDAKIDSKIILRVFDLLGQSVVLETAKSDSDIIMKELDLSNLAKGVYVLTVEIEGVNVKTISVVVE